MSVSLRVIVPIGIVVGVLALIVILIKSGPSAEPKAVERPLPSVQIQAVKKQSVSIPVQSRGTVEPRTKIQLIPEVNGRVLEVSPKLAAGNFFKKDDVLLRLDDSQYRLELTKAKSQVTSAKLHLKTVEAKNKARRKVTQLHRVEQEEAQAKYNAAVAGLESTRSQLKKTTILAPFDGRVSVVNVGFGQNVAAGNPIAEIYAVDLAEVRLPLSDKQLQLVNVPMIYEDDEPDKVRGSQVKLRASGSEHFWMGHIVRAEGSVDPTNRIKKLVARVERPYSRDPKQPGRPPLAAGQYVEAIIQGHMFDNMVVLPRTALRNVNQVWLLNEEKRLHIKEVDVMYKGRDRVYIQSGLGNGDQVIVTPLDVAVEGMSLKVVEIEVMPKVVDPEGDRNPLEAAADALKRG